MEIKIESILLAESKYRQRKEMGDIEGLAESIKRRGLIQPIVIHAEPHDQGDNAGTRAEYTLVAGGRRLAAMKQLGMVMLKQHEHFRLLSDLNDNDLHEIELEENIKRKDMTWQEIVKSVGQYHNQQAEDWTQTQTAARLGLSAPYINQILMVYEAAKLMPDLWEQTTLTSASNIVKRKNERELDNALDGFLNLEDDAPVLDAITESTVADASRVFNAPKQGGEEEAPTSRVYASGASAVIMGDALEFFKSKSATRYNLIHCDFPYGVSMDSAPLQGTRTDFQKYEDSPDIYWALLNAMLEYKENFMSSSCHVMFWFSMKFYTPTVEAFTKAGFVVNPMPLIWMKSDNKGLLPDAQRGPRQIYETALLATRGDRKIIRAVSNAFAAPTNKADALHLSEKPVEVLNHFLTMLVDETTFMLDPTCGAASALVAAEELGASVALGIEKLSENVDAAKRRIKTARERKALLT